MNYKNLVIILMLLIFFTHLNAKPRRRYVRLKKGETLWRISHRYKIPVETLKRINNIKDISKLKVGQKIYLYKKSKKRYKKQKIKKRTNLHIKLKYPVNGTIVSDFGKGENLTQLNGIDFKTKKHSYVRAAYSGIVKYTGKIRGYGKVIIVQSSKNISMIYANLDKIFVKKNQKIVKTQKLGTVGKSSICKDYVLHFELLSNGEPINPKKYFD